MPFVISDCLSDSQSFEFVTFHCGMVEKDVAFVPTDESEAFFRYDFFNGPLRHLATLHKFWALLLYARTN